MEFWACRTASSSSASNIGALTTAVVCGVKADAGPESPRQPPDSPIPGGDVRRKVHPQPEEGDSVGSPGEGGKVEGGVRKRGVLEGGFLGRKRAPPVPHLSSVPSGSEGGGSDSSSNASPSPTKLTSSTSPRHRKLAPELSNQDSSLWQHNVPASLFSFDPNQSSYLVEASCAVGACGRWCLDIRAEEECGFSSRKTASTASTPP